ncbi:MAG: hypothetical protein AB3N14_10230 [Flavobacteriaceae bacterium]
MGTKQRHGCLTALLIFMIVINAITALSYLFMGDTISQNFPGGVSNTTMFTLALFGFANIIFAIFLFKWKKIGFWGFVGSSLVALAINLNIGLSIGQSLLGLLGVAILYGVLQIKQNDVSGWDNLE